MQPQVVHAGGAFVGQAHVTGQDAGIQRGAVQNADVDRGVHESQDAAVLLADPAHDAHQTVLCDDRHPGADALRLADVDDKGAGGIIRHPRDDGGRLQRVIGVAVADAEELAVQVVLVFQLVVIRLAAGQLIDQRLQLLVLLLQLPPVEDGLEEILQRPADAGEEFPHRGGHGAAEMGKGGHQLARVYRTQKEGQHRSQQHGDDFEGLTAKKIFHAVSSLLWSAAGQRVGRLSKNRVRE